LFHSEENCKRTVALVEEQLEKSGIFLKQKPSAELEAAEEANEAKPEEVVVELRSPKVCPGASPALLLKQQEKQLSKSALRRLKRKQQNATGEKDEEDDEESKTVSTAATTTASSATAAMIPLSAPVPAPVPVPVPAPVVKPVETLSMADLMDDFSSSVSSPFKLSSLAKLSLGATTTTLPTPVPVAVAPSMTPSAKPAPSFTSTPDVPPGLWAEPNNGHASIPSSTATATNASTASSDGKYFKSRSGFSVRL